MTTYPQGFRIHPRDLTPDGGPFMPRSQWLTVDIYGRGDFYSLSAAKAAASAGDTIYVLTQGSASATQAITVNLTIIFAPGVGHTSAFLQNCFTVNACTLTLIGQGNNTVAGSTNGVRLLNATANLNVFNMNIRGGNAGALYAVNAGSIVKARNTVFNAPFAPSNLGLSVPNALAAGTEFEYCAFAGSVDGATSTGGVWANAPFFHCTFEGGRNQITFAAGNTNNVDF